MTTWHPATETQSNTGNRQRGPARTSVGPAFGVMLRNVGLLVIALESYSAARLVCPTTVTVRLYCRLWSALVPHRTYWSDTLQTVHGVDDLTIERHHHKGPQHTARHNDKVC